MKYKKQIGEVSLVLLNSPKGEFSEWATKVARGDGIKKRLLMEAFLDFRGGRFLPPEGKVLRRVYIYEDGERRPIYV